MSIRVALVVPACIAMIVGSPAVAADIPLPTGSYLRTCKVVSFDQSSGELAADCEGPSVGMFGHGKADTSHMNVRGCKEGTIWNDQRQLYCLSAEPWGNERVIPPGSYIDTCTDRKVVGGALLTARCGAPDGVSFNASLDLRPCTWGKDIYNNRGQLSCTGPMATALSPNFRVGDQSQGDGVVKPVAVEPGVVKPVMVAPLSPTASSTRDDPASGEKKKKRRRDRGERG